MKILYTFFILLFSSENFYSQNQLNDFKDKIDFNMLGNLVSMSTDDSIFVSNSKQYDLNGYGSKNDYYFYNSKTKNKIFPYGYEMAYPFVGKTAIVKYNSCWGLIDRTGKFIYYSGVPDIVKLSSYEKYAVFGRALYDLRTGMYHETSIYCAEPATPDYFISKTKNGKYNLTNGKNEAIFKTEMDSIVSQDDLLYKGNSIRNLLIVTKKNKYGLFHTNGSEILKIKYEKARFVGNYFMLFENNTWNYYIYKNNKLNLILSTPFECITPAYQPDIIGAFKRDNKYNLLKRNGEVLSESFEFINDNATYGINGNVLVIFDSNGNYYNYTEK